MSRMVLPVAPALGASYVSRWSRDQTLTSHEHRPNAATTSIWQPRQHEGVGERGRFNRCCDVLAALYCAHCSRPMESSVLSRPVALARRDVEVWPHPMHATRARARQHLEHRGMGRGDDERPCLSDLEGAAGRGCPWSARAWQAEPCLP